MQPPPQAPSSHAESAIAVALGRIPSGLFVVAWRDGDADRCMLASWVMQAGFTPPQISVAIAESRGLAAAIERGQAFVVSVLCESQRGLLARFGKPGPDAFAGLAVHRPESAAAALTDAAAWLECRAVARAAHGDHMVVIAEVMHAGGGGGDPAVHLRRNGLRY